MHTTLSLLQLKARNGWSDKSFGELLGVIKKLLPEENAHYYRNLNQGRHNSLTVVVFATVSDTRPRLIVPFTEAVM